MSAQKARWTARAKYYEALAAKARAESVRLYEPREYESDLAFLTQPGRVPARDRMRRRLDRASEMAAKAARYAEKAANLRALASRNAGDAERARDVLRTRPIKVGDLTDSIWGRRRVTKVNRKTVRLDGVSEPVDRALVRVVAEAFLK